MRKDFKELLVWQHAHLLTLEVYRITQRFPQEERFGLSNQLRRAVVSVESNIAEGSARNTSRDFLQFLFVARGSLAEVEVQLLIAKDLGYITDDEFVQANTPRLSAMKLLQLLIKKNITIGHGPASGKSLSACQPVRLIA